MVSAHNHIIDADEWSTGSIVTIVSKLISSFRPLVIKRLELSLQMSMSSRSTLRSN